MIIMRLVNSPFMDLQWPLSLFNNLSSFMHFQESVETTGAFPMVRESLKERARAASSYFAATKTFTCWGTGS